MNTPWEVSLQGGPVTQKRPQIGHLHYLQKYSRAVALPLVSGGNTKNANFENKQLDALKKKCRVGSNKVVIGRGRGWDKLGEWHWNMYNIIYETNRQSRFDAWYWMLGAGALGWPSGMVRGVRGEGGSGWGTRVYLWQILVDVWQKKYNIVK